MNIVTPVNLTSTNYTSNVKNRVTYSQMDKAQHEDQIQLSFKSGNSVANKKGLLTVLFGMLTAAAGIFAGKNEIDFSEPFDPAKYESFRDIPGERRGHHIYQKNSDGIVVRKFSSSDKKKLDSMSEYDPVTGNKIKETEYWLSQKTISMISEYDPKTGDFTKIIKLMPDGNTIDYIEENKSKDWIKETYYRSNGDINYIKFCKFDPVTGKEIKKISIAYWEHNSEKARSISVSDFEAGKSREITYQSARDTIFSICEFDHKTKKSTKTYYGFDGKTIDNIVENDPKTGKMIKNTVFRDDGKTIDHIFEYDPQTENLIREMFYWPDGEIDGIEERDPKTGKLIRETTYWTGSSTIMCIEERDPKTKKLIRETTYWPKKGTIKHIIERDPETGNLIREMFYWPDGKIDGIEERDPKTGKLIRETTYWTGSSTIMFIKEHDPETENLIRETNYWPEDRLRSIGEHDPETGILTKKYITVLTVKQ